MMPERVLTDDQINQIAVGGKKGKKALDTIAAAIIRKKRFNGIYGVGQSIVPVNFSFIIYFLKFPILCVCAQASTELVLS